MKKKISIYMVMSIVFLFITALLAMIFVYEFWGRSLPTSLEQWGDFAAFADFLASMLNLVLFIILTDKASEFEKNSYSKQDEFQKATFAQQMLAQKVQLQTDLRKAHIDEIRKRLLDLNNLTYYKLEEADSFQDFKRECDSLARIFKIFEENKNVNIVGNCSYSDINMSLKELLKVNMLAGDVAADSQQKNEIWEKLNNVNKAIITLEKELMDYAVSELQRAFSSNM